METVDTIKINFNPNNLLVLNAILALLMFGIALDIHKKDFDLLWKNPKPAIVGMMGQLIILPLVTVGLVFVFNPPPSVALGMIAISACPGGNNSNYTTHLAKGNTALAITTTSISVIACILTMPLYIWLGAKIVPNMASLNREVSINPFDMFKIVGGLILTPLVIGMTINSRLPKVADKIRKPFKILSLILFFGLIFGALAANLNNILQFVGKVFTIVLVLNALAFAVGYGLGKINKLPEADCRALTFETGIHNVTLALIIIFNFFDGLGGMALVAAWYGIWDLVTGFSLATWWGRKGLVTEGV
ncbi:MAG: bile acid:sodium symporter family protein [Saprospiraceae bacterium]|nr:bile acid:sodium symporter family protein [Saprospiraceae bacterium]